jgi:putative membrane protein insertion efficiency factor
VPKKLFILTAVIIALFTEYFAAYGQVPRDVNFILDHIGKKRAVSDSTMESEAMPPGELQLVGAGVIRIYQTLISSQDVPACNFNPSCSHFAEQAIKEGGFFKGTLLAADRLMRCHFFSSPQCFRRESQYREEKSAEIYDPVGEYLPSEK